MNLKTIFITLLVLFSAHAFAWPKNFEVWFIKKPLNAWLDNILIDQYKSSKIVQSQIQCQPMGEYCFDPQVGLYKKGEENKVQERVDLSLVESESSYDFMEVPEKMEREMINCDDANFFDIFCGKAQKKMKEGRSDLEIWVDTSSTMKQIDFNGFDKKCAREVFLESLAQTCPLNKKMKVYYFESFLKEAGSFDRVCLSGGVNNMKRILQELKKSKAKNVILITDIFEAEQSFISEIENSGRGKIRGLDKPLYANEIKNELKRVRKLCQ